MNGKLLVAYVTRYGSTAEVAEAVGARLRERGFDVDVKPVKQASSLDGYDAVVFSTPFYLGAMLKEGRAWLESGRRPTPGPPLSPRSAPRAPPTTLPRRPSSSTRHSWSCPGSDR